MLCGKRLFDMQTSAVMRNNLGRHDSFTPFLVLMKIFWPIFILFDTNHELVFCTFYNILQLFYFLSQHGSLKKVLNCEKIQFHKKCCKSSDTDF
jgi:hypothetical protein